MSGHDMSQYRKKYERGDVLINEGEEGKQLFLLEKGTLDVLIHGRKVNSIDAKGSHDFVGEIGAVLGTPRTATVVAATDCVVLCLPKIELESAIKTSPSLGIKLIRSLCEKLLSSSSALAEFHVKHASILDSGNTETSLRNYMKGVLYFVESAAKADAGDGTKDTLDYFLKTNPWGMQHGDQNHILPYFDPVRSSSGETGSDGEEGIGEDADSGDLPE